MDFWSNPEGWPKDMGPFVFLPRAVNQIGQSRFGERWIGVAGGGYPYALPLSSDEASEEELAKVVSTLKVAEPEAWAYQAREAVGLEDAGLAESRIDYPGGSYIIANELWDRARTLLGPSGAGEEDPYNQWQLCLTYVVELLRSGELRAFLGAKRGGKPEPVPADRWFFQTWAERFERCSADSDNFYATAATGDDSWIYVSADSLEAVIRPRLGGWANRSRPTYLSPYLELGIEASKSLAITEENQPDNHVIFPVLTRLWHAAGYPPEKMSGRVMSALATIMRDLEGLNQKTRKKRSAGNSEMG